MYNPRGENMPKEILIFHAYTINIRRFIKECIMKGCNYSKYNIVHPDIYYIYNYVYYIYIYNIVDP